MILSDGGIRKRLEEIQFDSGHPYYSFDQEKQIKQCSVDLRLSDVIWKPVASKAIDLSDSTPLGPSVANAFKQKKIDVERGYILKPGDFIRGRTLEKFRVPNDLSASLRGRSSFGRLGLSVVSPSSSINPGWQGHMPLMLINHSSLKIRIVPFVSIVQVYFFELDQEPQRLYGSEGADSKYQFDDGGPSRYWLDHSVSEIQKSSARNAQATPETTRKLMEYSKNLDERTRKRLAKCIKEYGTISDVRDFMDTFLRKELLRDLSVWIVGLFALLPVGIIVRYFDDFSRSLAGWGSIVVLVAVSLLVIVWMVRRKLSNSISLPELRRLAKETRIM